MSEAVLDLAGIEKTYNRGRPGQVEVLRGLDLQVARAEIVALVAPSGAGKSTLLHIAGLLDTADAGKVAIAGREMTGLSDRARTEARRRDVGFVYQFHHLLPEFTAAENIVLPQLADGTGRRAAEARAAHLLDLVGVGARAAHRPAALSGGTATGGLLPRPGKPAKASSGRRADRQSGPGDLRQGFCDTPVAGARNRAFGADRHP